MMPRFTSLNNRRAAALVVLSLLCPAALAVPPSLLESGQRQFKLRCAACHATSASGPSEFGPHLESIVGRKAAALADYAYSDALRAEVFYWSEEQLERWLERPQQQVPDLCMPFMGVSNPQQRRALLAYLKTLIP